MNSENVRRLLQAIVVVAASYFGWTGFQTIQTQKAELLRVEPAGNTDSLN